MISATSLINNNAKGDRLPRRWRATWQPVKNRTEPRRRVCGVPRMGQLCWLPPIRVSMTPPLDDWLHAFARAAADAPIANFPQGCIESESYPRGWFVNHREVKVGCGRKVFLECAAALNRLECMNHSWLRCSEADGVLVVCARQFGVVWLSNVNRMLPRQSSSGPRARACTVGWQCTRKHVLSGEEQLRVRWDRDSGVVTFRVLSYARPRHALSIVGLPVVLLQQRRFARDAARVMQAAAYRAA
eukprot:scaffold11925_cov101-Isochrysis_galbana.AAC.1